MKYNNKSGGRRRKTGGLDPFSGSENQVNSGNANPDVNNNTENKPNVQEQMNKMGSDVKNSVDNALSGAKSSFSGISNWFKNIMPKKSTDSAPPSSSPSLLESNPTFQSAGKRTRKRGGGGYKPSADYGLASSAAPINGIKTASANAYVGGRKKRRNSKKTRKSRKTRRH